MFTHIPTRHKVHSHVSLHLHLTCSPTSQHATKSTPTYPFISTRRVHPLPKTPQSPPPRIPSSPPDVFTYFPTRHKVHSHVSLHLHLTCSPTSQHATKSTHTYPFISTCRVHQLPNTLQSPPLRIPSSPPAVFTHFPTRHKVHSHVSLHLHLTYSPTSQTRHKVHSHLSLLLHLTCTPTSQHATKSTHAYLFISTCRVHPLPNTPQSPPTCIPSSPPDVYTHFPTRHKVHFHISLHFHLPCSPTSQHATKSTPTYPFIST